MSKLLDEYDFREICVELKNMLASDFGDKNVDANVNSDRGRFKVITREIDNSGLYVPDGWTIEYIWSDVVEQVKSIAWMVLGKEPSIRHSGAGDDGSWKFYIDSYAFVEMFRGGSGNDIWIFVTP